MVFLELQPSIIEINEGRSPPSREKIDHLSHLITYTRHLMSNTYFQFKQFRINQDKSAMKVTTEGCLLGAITEKAGAQQILDIGSGTGLLALMLAQRTTAQIATIEADHESYRQASENIAASPWSNRIVIKNETIQDFAAQCTGKFDLIVSNPPFYTNYLPSDDLQLNLAKHTYSLSMADLVAVVDKLLTDDGLFYVLYPPYEAGLFARMAEKHRLFPNKNVVIRNKPDGGIFRMITAYGRDKATHTQDQLVIRDGENAYTPEFVELLGAYYLAF